MSVLKIKDKNGNIIEIPAFKGDKGLSAYEIAVNNGFEGTEDEWLLSLKGDKGDKGDPGTAINVDQTYNAESENAQSGKAVAQAVEHKLDKMTDKVSQVASGKMCPEFYAVDNVNGVPSDTLLIGSFDSDIHTVPIRDDIGGLVVTTPEWIEGTRTDHKGRAANTNYVDSVIAKALSNLHIPTFVPRKLNHEWIAANGTVPITRSTMYFCCGSKTDVCVVDETGKNVTDSENKPIDPSRIYILIVPENTTKYDTTKYNGEYNGAGYMCFSIRVIGSSVGAGNIFVPTADMEAGNRFIKTTGGMNVWTMPFDL